MRTSLFSVLAALVSIASTLPTGYSAHQGRVAARDPAKARSPPEAPPNLQRNVPRAAPSGHPARAVEAPATKPSGLGRRADAAAASKPSGNARRAAAAAVPSGRTKRAPQDQRNLFGGSKFVAGLLGWQDEDQCPSPLSACPVRGARDPDAFECVDLESDLYSCGGCAADDIAYDCNAISHARSVECVSGFCEVRSCAQGYVVAPTRDVCVRVGAR